MSLYKEKTWFFNNFTLFNVNIRKKKRGNSLRHTDTLLVVIKTVIRKLNQYNIRKTTVL